MSDWNAEIIDEFRANDGEVGGQFEGAPMLLERTDQRASARRVRV